MSKFIGLELGLTFVNVWMREMLFEVWLFEKKIVVQRR